MGNHHMILNVHSTRRNEFIDITGDIQQLISRSEPVFHGYCLLFVLHTTAGITINEAADPSVTEDIQMMLNRLAPCDPLYRHQEGNSDAHIKSTLVGVSQYIPIEDSRLLLGTWQGIFFCEFDGPRNRKVVVQLGRNSSA
jgi:secondary thiamine-phosphate synthase enzyme